MVSSTYRKLLAPSALKGRREELARLEALAAQLLSRIDELRAEIARAEGTVPEDPKWDQEITPVVPSRWTK